MVKGWKHFPYDQEQNKDVHFHNCHSTLYWKFSLIRKRNRSHSNWKGKVKLFPLHRWHDLMYRRPQRIHKKASRAVNEFNKVVGYKINTKKSIVFLYTSQINIFPKRYTNLSQNLVERGLTRYHLSCVRNVLFIPPTKGTTPYLNTGITPFIRDNH